eukprot:TRINITY_DN1044_c4_g1_i3.p1 TRINITY_DN1044_c4_g1~~TRINITY_DN1044_c4_g1_i3.p1  ORF type:complete len:395 (+),score=97.46 TRINITY_DN1044_c4_g1_i3:116-1300(+)
MANTSSPKPQPVNSKSPKKGKKEDGWLSYHIRATFGPLFLMTSTPTSLVIVWMINQFYDGSILRFVREITWKDLTARWPVPDLTTVSIVLTFAVFEALLLVFVPGRIFKGPITPAGNQPTYRLNGVASYLLSLATLIICFVSGVIPLDLVYDNLGKILQFMSYVSFVFCIFLYFKGIYFPSSTDSGTSGNIVWDFYWGTELHPQLSSSFNLKQYCNCRLGMMGWAVLIVCFAAKQYSQLGYITNSSIASLILQQIYIFKFYLWEDGYFASLDIMHDRFGYYICWGVLSWIAGIYTFVSQFLVNHPIDLPPVLFYGYLALGIFFVWANYDADAQRLRVRQTKGNTTVWGSKPKIMTAKYKTSDGKEHSSILLLSGWWGIARHVHYSPHSSTNIHL